MEKRIERERMGATFFFPILGSNWAALKENPMEKPLPVTSVHRKVVRNRKSTKMTEVSFKRADLPQLGKKIAYGILR